MENINNHNFFLIIILFSLYRLVILSIRLNPVSNIVGSLTLRIISTHVLHNLLVFNSKINCLLLGVL